MRRKTKVIKIGKVRIGGDNRIVVQGMTKTNTTDVVSTINQIKDLKQSGADIVRIALDSHEAAEAFRLIRRRLPDIALVADIHFDYSLAIKALKYGVDKIRLNPGNINKPEEIKSIAKLAKRLKKPIRIGVNSGSVWKVKKGDNVEAMVQAATSYIKMLERFGFYDIVLSLKSSDIRETVEANRIMAGLSRYPIHLGITATGVGAEALIKSSIGIGALLLDGIGDTIRVSLTSSAAEEVKAARYILQALNLAQFTHQIISCPTCGRCSVKLIDIAEDIQKRLQSNGLIGYNNKSKVPYKIAVMGCIVNGPGEAKEADFGIAFSKKRAAIFRKGRILETAPVNLAEAIFLKLIKRGLP